MSAFTTDIYISYYFGVEEEENVSLNIFFKFSPIIRTLVLSVHLETLRVRGNYITIGRNKQRDRKGEKLAENR